ncbi:FUN14 family-domain-containing protein [Halteromyces radiatus]|uniref:FUN14 family-domain-containing protein n=1 Tax=Halteromyces radiatus TaxID=101107 RepID=UPI00221F5C7D|nr:FUN14 family-domain-containing protein [Halteromyces radiatus]KAI8093881.1 FUN14 family-domain-containing protein [Halteromyces radiatus]
MLRTIRPLTCFQTTAQHSIRRTITSVKPSVKPFTSIGQNMRYHSMSWSGPVKMVGIAAAATGTMTASMWTKKPVQCQAVYTQVSDITPRDKDRDARKTLFHKGELSFGVLLGFCTGYLIKKVGKFFALAVGVGFVFLQCLSYNGYITIHWDKLEGGYNKQLGTDEHGKVTTKVIRTKWNKFTGFLTHNLQFKSTFMVGLYGGIRYG